MEALGVIGLLAGLAIMVLGAFLEMSAVPLTLLASTAVILLNGINLWTGYSSWAAGFGSTFTTYYLMFFASCCFAVAMELTGACNTIARAFIKWFGKNHVLLVLSILCSVLCYGGVSFFVVMFAVGPIIFELLSEANLPKKLSIIPFAAGASSWVAMLPGSTQLNNVIPTQYLGTTLMSAPALGFIVGGCEMVACYIYAEFIERRYRKLVAAGESEGWTEEVATSALSGNTELPNIFCGFCPIVVCVVIIIVFSNRVSSTTMLACIAMAIAAVLALVLNWKFVAKKKWPSVKQLLSRSATQAASSALVLGAIVGLGTVVSSAGGLNSILNWLTSLNLNIYLKGEVVTAIMSGVCGSSSSGLQLTYSFLGDYFVSSGANLAILHRMMSIASITFDSVPYASGIFLMLSYLGVSFKDGYKHLFVCTLLVSLVACVIASIFVVLLF